MTDEVRTAEELHAGLRDLLRRAHSGDIETRGGWACHTGPGYPDWDVVVTEVERSEESE
jgi:hypothetical protein